MRRTTILTSTPVYTTILLLGLGGCGGKPSVQFGAVLPLSGPGQIYGESIKKGIDLAYEILSQDPQLGYTITLAVEDSATDPQQGTALLRTLYQSSLAAVGGVTSDEALAMVEAANAADKVLLSPSASSPDLSGVSQNFYRIFPNSMDETVAMANFAKETLKLESLSLVVENGAYGAGLAESMVVVFDGEIEATFAFSPGDDVDGVVSQVMESGTNAVYLAVDGSELSRLLRALRAAGFDKDNQWILASSALANPNVVAAAEGAAERSFLTQTVFDPTSQEEPMRSFADHFQTRYGAMPDFFAAHGYDAFLVLVEALQEGGGTMTSEFKKGMRSISNFPGVTGNIQFRESGDVQKFMRVFYIYGGQLQDYEEMMKRKREELQQKMDDIRRRREQLMRESG